MPRLLCNDNPEMLGESLANIEAEQAVLGALLVNNEAMLRVGQLRREHFYEPVHQRIFTWMQYCWERQIKFDPISMRPRFDSDEALADIGGGAYLAKLAAVAVTVINIADYAEIIIDMAQRQAMFALWEGAKAELFNITKMTEIVMRVSNDMQKSISDGDAKMFQNDFDVTESIIADMKRDVRPYSTGYSKLDEAMDGGLYPGKSYGIAARKKLGKTILAGSIAQNLNEKGVRHLFICGEMSPAEVQKRTLGRLLRKNSQAFNGQMGKQTLVMQEMADIMVNSGRNIIYRNAPGLTFDDLKRYVLLARMQKKITGFILDYWQLVGGKRKGQSTAEHLDEVAQWIADTCRKYDLWSIVMAQINQEGNTRGGEGIRLAFDQVYVLRAPNDDAGRSERWLEMSDTRYTSWRSVGNANNPGFYLNEFGPHFSEKAADDLDLGEI